ncbi:MULTISPECIES: hypothetical protein [Shewanella]|uniref:hypothetical protein n=1 Tax=Shewanella TaxID=22 RepID=UPI000EC5F031|nr:hypothetical protein [Shewanella sp.]HCD12172.1 hypothetical protein [Shewanella sp.]
MARRWLWVINLLILIFLLGCLLVIYRFSQTAPALALNCSSELYDRQLNEGEDAQHYLLLDLQTKGKRALVNYRYFNMDGTPAGSILMQGQLASEEAGRYQILVTDKQELSGKGERPAHMQYLSYVSSFNLSNEGLHHLALEILDADEAKDYAIVLFQPSNTVCGCRLIH